MGKEYEKARGKLLMDGDKYCLECLKDNVWKYGQGHHVVSRKQAPYMIHVPINIVPLCECHHTAAPTGIHHNKAMMLQYKQKLQLNLKLELTKEYYTHSELKNLLDISDNTVKAITKTLMRYKEGWKREDLIFHMMGDRNYLEE